MISLQQHIHSGLIYPTIFIVNEQSSEPVNIQVNGGKDRPQNHHKHKNQTKKEGQMRVEHEGPEGHEVRRNHDVKLAPLLQRTLEVQYVNVS